MKIHVMGIGGSGASAMASIAKARGYQVSGCDTDQKSPYLEELTGIKVDFKHDPSHLKGIDWLILSPAIESLDRANPEVVEAKRKGLPVRSWQEFTGQELMKNQKVVAITGTHGKTTTTAMVALILERAGLDPTVIVGASVKEWEKNFRIGGGDLFVIEADEYGDNFLNYQADIAVVTNLEMDHPEYYSNIDHLRSSFTKFVQNMKEKSVLFTGSGVDLTNSKGETVQVTTMKFDLKVLGSFNQVNATFANHVCEYLGVKGDLIKETLSNFPGAGRRLELLGEVDGLKIYDDYGHHPTEITVTTQALREKYPTSEIWLIYQPHMYTRTKYLFDDFVTSLRNAPVDQVILTDIWQSREKEDYNVKSEQLVEKIAKSSVRKMVNYTDIAVYIMTHKNTDSIALFMGAGDIYLASRQLLKSLKESNHD
jgi:UDP-N-acetylmuramate--alanine ligase